MYRERHSGEVYSVSAAQLEPLDLGSNLSVLL